MRKNFQKIKLASLLLGKLLHEQTVLVSTGLPPTCQEWVKMRRHLEQCGEKVRQVATTRPLAGNRLIDQADSGEKGKRTQARVGTANPLLYASLRGNRRFVLARVTPNCLHTAPYASEGCPICWSSHFLCVEKDTKQEANQITFYIN